MEEKEITTNEYQVRAMDTCLQSCENVAYMLYNLIGEVGEVSEKLVQNLEYKAPENIILQHLKIFVEVSKFYGKASKQIRKEENPALRYASEEIQSITYSMTEQESIEIEKELGDILWQLNGLCSILGFELDEVAKQNLEKLASRKERNKIDGDGDNR